MIVCTVLNGAWLSGRLLLGALLGGTMLTPAAAPAQPKPGIIRLEIQTSLGTIALEVDSARAPRTDVTKLHHGDGALSMARGGPNTATSSFFIVIGDQPELDFGGKRNPDG